ncbi:hypothetical protein HEFE104084_01875 [Helicobacter felis]
MHFFAQLVNRHKSSQHKYEDHCNQKPSDKHSKVIVVIRGFLNLMVEHSPSVALKRDKNHITHFENARQGIVITLNFFILRCQYFA